MSVTSAELDQRIVASVSSRYSDAYIVARTINAFGQTVKIGGMILGGIILLGSLVVGSRGGVGGVFAFAGFMMAVVVAAAFFLFGTLTSAQGQILMSTLDTAVNSSPLLSNAERVRLITMSSSESAGQRPYSTIFNTYGFGGRHGALEVWLWTAKSCRPRRLFGLRRGASISNELRHPLVATA